MIHKTAETLPEFIGNARSGGKVSEWVIGFFTNDKIPAIVRRWEARTNFKVESGWEFYDPHWDEVNSEYVPAPDEWMPMPEGGIVGDS